MSSSSKSPQPSSTKPEEEGFRPSFLERHGLRSPPTPPPYRTPVEQKAEDLRLLKIEREKIKQQKEKVRIKKEKEYIKANSSVGVFTQNYKKNDGDISWWKMFAFS